MNMPSDDPRRLGNGRIIPSLAGYCDQPYVVRLRDGVWLCVMTTGTGEEGQPGQRIVAMRSADQGVTWSAMVDIQPPDGREASWVMPFLTPYGRVYAFYTFNRDNLRRVATDPGHEACATRVDTLGVFAFRWSDDGGCTWSADHGEVPLPEAEIDRTNPYGSAVRFFWGVGKPILHQGTMVLGFARVGGFGSGFMARSEGALVASANIASEREIALLRFTILPEGATGLRAPCGPRAEETCVAGLTDGTLFCAYRGVDGFLMHGYSRDGGRSFATGYATYAPGGRRLKHPLACAPVWRLRDGRFLLWFHNHGGRGYEGRNPVWLCGGRERDGVIHWSQPEVVLYDPETSVRISYPDLIEEADGSLFLTETQKSAARLHRLPAALVEGLFRQADPEARAPEDAWLRLPGPGRATWTDGARPWSASGLSLCFTVDLPRCAAGLPLIVWDEPQLRLAVQTTGHGSFALELPGAAWAFASDQVKGPGRHRVVLILDARLRRSLLVIDGELVDGGSEQQYGQGPLGEVTVGTERSATVTAHQRVSDLAIFDRALSVSEAVLLTRPAAGQKTVDVHTASPEEVHRTSPDRIIFDPTDGVRRAWEIPTSSG